MVGTRPYFERWRVTGSPAETWPVIVSCLTTSEWRYSAPQTARRLLAVRPRSHSRTLGTAVSIADVLALRIGLVAALLTVTVAASAAPPYDGSKPMQCAIETVLVCSNPQVCVRGTAQTVNLPPVITVDVAQRLISGAATGRTVKITSVSRDGGRLMIYGSEIGGSWSAAVVEDSGYMTSAVLSRDGGFLMFGSCSAS